MPVPVILRVTLEAAGLIGAGGYFSFQLLVQESDLAYNQAYGVPPTPGSELWDAFRHGYSSAKMAQLYGLTRHKKKKSLPPVRVDFR